MVTTCFRFPLVAKKKRISYCKFNSILSLDIKEGNTLYMMKRHFLNLNKKKQLFFADPPREPVVNDSMTVLEGNTLALHCSTQGSPAPTLTWLKDGELVGTITADELSVLEIVEITPQGDGQYRCLAENEHGRASSSFNITVECECFTVLHFTQD